MWFIFILSMVVSCIVSTIAVWICNKILNGVRKDNINFNSINEETDKDE